MLCKEHIFLVDASLLKQSVRRLFLVGLAIVYHPAGTFHVELICASVRVFVCMLILTITGAIVLVITCTIIRTIFLVGLGFEPCPCSMIFSEGLRSEPLPLQHDFLWVQGWVPWP